MGISKQALKQALSYEGSHITQRTAVLALPHERKGQEISHPNGR